MAASSKKKWWILANISVGTFMATLDGSIANVALPTISHAFMISLHTVQWVVTAYLLTICAMLPIIGKIADRIGRNRVYNAGFLLFSLGSLLCSLSGHIAWLILSRILQGIGASLLMANNQAIVASTFAVTQRGRAMGITGAMVSLGSLTGPAIGGILVSAFGWPSIFYINVPIGVIGFVAGLFILSAQPMTTKKEPFDYLGSSLFILGITLFLYAFSNAPTWGLTSPLTYGGLVIAIILLALFVLRERKAKFPMLDLTLFAIRAFRTGTLAAMLSFISLFCTTVMMPFFMMEALHYSPSTTGYVMAAYPLTMVLTAPISGAISDKIGPFWLTTSGLLLNVLGFILLNSLSTSVAPWLVALHMAIFGIGQGMFQSPNNAAVMGSVDKARLSVASGINALVRNIGMVLGISLSVLLFSYQMFFLTGRFVQVGVEVVDPKAFLTSLHTVFYAAALAALLGAIASVRRRRSPSSKQNA